MHVEYVMLPATFFCSLLYTYIGTQYPKLFILIYYVIKRVIQSLAAADRQKGLLDEMELLM
jgi:hypothetical protein